MQSDPTRPIPTQTRALPLHDAISAQARQLWEHYGQPAGRDDEIWLEAERQVLGVDSDVTHVSGGAAASSPLRTAVNPPRSPATAPRPAAPPAASTHPLPAPRAPGR